MAFNKCNMFIKRHKMSLCVRKNLLYELHNGFVIVYFIFLLKYFKSIDQVMKIFLKIDLLMRNFSRNYY